MSLYEHTVKRLSQNVISQQKECVIVLSPTVCRPITKALRSFTGAIYILEPWRKHFAYLGEHQIADFDGNVAMRLRLSEHMESKIFWYGHYSRDILLVMGSILKSGMTVFDVGANIGEISCFAANRVGSQGQVVSFEPSADIAARIKAHKEMNNFNQISIEQLGLSDESGSLPLFSSHEYHADGMQHSGMMTLHRSEDRAQPAGHALITTLDSYVEENSTKAIDLVKIDIEGAELAMLRGSRITLSRFKPAIIVEVNEDTCRTAGYAPGDILGFLSDLGYRFEKIGRKGRLRPIDVESLDRFQNILCRVPE